MIYNAKFDFFLKKEYFIQNGRYALRHFNSYILINILEELSKYKKFTWETLKENNNKGMEFNNKQSTLSDKISHPHFHKVKREKITTSCECFKKQNKSEMQIYQIKIFGKSRLLFFKINNICFPVVYNMHHDISPKK